MKKNKSHKSSGKPDHFLPDGRQRIIGVRQPRPQAFSCDLKNHTIKCRGLRAGNTREENRREMGESAWQKMNPTWRITLISHCQINQ